MHRNARTMAIAGAVLAAASAAHAATVDVYVFNFDFSVHHPSSGVIEDAVINVGDTVRWLWVAGLHSVTSNPDSTEVFDSGLLTPPGTFEYTFMNEGEFMYHCSVHSEQHPDGHITGMVGMVTVMIPAPGAGALAMGAMLAGLRRKR
jgi:plastocyanin